MKNIKKSLSIGFHAVNIVIIIFYLFPGSILGFYLYDDISLQPQLTRDFIISSNHLYIFIILSILGIFSHQNKKTFKFVIIYLFLLSIILELLHIIIPLRGFEWSDLLGNIVGVIFGIVIYKIKNKYV